MREHFQPAELVDLSFDLAEPVTDLLEPLLLCPACGCEVLDGDGPDCANCGEPLPRSFYESR